MKEFNEVRQAIGGIKGVMRALGDAPPFDHKWKSMESCPFCGRDGKGKAGVFTKGGVDFFKCHNPGCSSGGVVMAEVGYIAARLGLSDQKPEKGPSPAYRKFLELANCWEEPTSQQSPPPPRATPPPKDEFQNNVGEALKKASASPGCPTPVPQGTMSDVEHSGKAPASSDCGEDEELIQNCIEVIRLEQKASVSLLQRRLKLGYTRASRIMDEIERRGFVGPVMGCEPREILNLPPAPSGGNAAEAGAHAQQPAPPPTNSESAPPKPDEKIIPFPGSEQAKEPEKNLPAGLAVLRKFYTLLPPTQHEMKAYLPGDRPVPSPLPGELARQLKFKPVPMFERRGLETETCRRLGFRANPPSNEDILKKLLEEAGGDWDEFVAAGVALPPDRKRKLDYRFNNQFFGKGQVGKKPASERKNKDDKWHWGWCEPVLIPFFDEKGELVRLRPHKGGAPEGTIGGTRLFIPRAGGKPCVEKFYTVVICEGEYKASALWQMVGGGSALPEKKRIGVCALPGISYAKNVEMREELEAWLWSTGCYQIVVAFDDEDKSSAPLDERFDALRYARYLAISLHQKMKKTVKVCVLPREWRDDKGKADWDGALVKLLRKFS